MDRMKNYIGDKRSYVMHDRDSDNNIVAEYELGLEIVFEYSKDDVASWMPAAKYDQLSKKVYRKLHFSLTSFDELALDDIDDGDGHGAIHSVLGTAGTYQQQLADLGTILGEPETKGHGGLC